MKNKGQNLQDVVAGIFMLFISIVVGGALSKALEEIGAITGDPYDILATWAIASALIFLAELIAWVKLTKKWAESL